MRLEPWAAHASAATCILGPSFETPAFASLRRAPQDEVERGACVDGYALFKCSICGRSPLALAVIGGRGILAMPGSISKVYSSEYHGPFTSGAGAGSFSCST